MTWDSGEGTFVLTVVLGLRGLGGDTAADFAGGGNAALAKVLPSPDGERNARGFGGGGGVPRLAGRSV
jgi:hypothetical protein